MINQADYKLYKDGQEIRITIHPVIEPIPGGDRYSTGVFRLTEGDVGMGDIVFDDNMREWEYTGLGDLTHEQAGEIARFIKEQQ
jgi:hypothetical protein